MSRSPQTPSQIRLAVALKVLQAHQQQGKTILRSSDFEAAARRVLANAGFLRQVTRGWYLVTRPGEGPGNTTPWYAARQDFLAAYCTERFADDWHLDAGASLQVHAAATHLNKQVIVWASAGANNTLELPDGCSLLDYKPRDVVSADQVVRVGSLRVMALSTTLVRLAPTVFEKSPTDVQVAMNQVTDASEVCRELLIGGRSTVSGRLAGAFRAIGRDDIADQIRETMRAAGYVVNETNPFATMPPHATSVRVTSPHVRRMELLWPRMREAVARLMPTAPGLPTDTAAYLAQVAERYKADAYHSLSIEGYRVTDALIAKVASGKWRPETDAADADARNALAAHGYWLAHQNVTESIGRILQGAAAGETVWRDHGSWYRHLFAPSVTVGLLDASDLAGYRAQPVYIRNAQHVPPASHAVRDLMPALFDHLRSEPDAAVRAVLGHFFFVFVHPYPDGNGRMARFLMNAMLASGGYPWTVIPVEQRAHYFAALEAASVQENIAPFAQFVSERLVAPVEATDANYTPHRVSADASLPERTAPRVRPRSRVANPD
jgi:hypothetical protein